MIHFFSKYNKYLIICSVMSAIIIGIFFPSFFSYIKFLGDIFINLLKLFALPLICSMIIATLGNFSMNGSTLKSISKRMIGYMFLSEFIAVTIALCLFNVFQPGVGVESTLVLQDSISQIPQLQKFEFTNFILSIFTDNIFYSLTHFDLLPVVIFSILFGLGCASCRDMSKPVINFMMGVREISLRCLNGVMLFAPIGIFTLIGRGVAQSHLQGDLKKSFSSLVIFVLVLTLGLFLHGLWQLLVAAILSKQKISDILYKNLPVFSTAFGTSSSVATLPVAMNAADSLKSKPFITRLVLPLYAAINVGGMMMYEVAAVLFFSQVLGINLSFIQQVFIAFICIIGGMAEGGIPETSMVSLVVIFKIVNIPISAISFLLPLDRIIDRIRTMANIFGNICGVIIISQLTTEEKLVIDEPCFNNKLK